MTKENLKIIEAITEIDATGKMTAVASDESIDRVGDSIKVLDWDFKNWKKNPVLQAGHDYRPQFTIGIGKNIRVEDGKVLFEPEFHSITELAREIGEMYKQGVLKAWSVGYIPTQKEGGKNELLEISAVAVPANANALVIAKGMKPEEEVEIKGKIEEFVKKEVKADDSTDSSKSSTTSSTTTTLAPEEKKTEKSPACRMEDETEEDCRQRKIDEIHEEDPDMEMDQVVAIAYDMCKTKCSEKTIKENQFKVFEIKGAVSDELKKNEIQERKWKNIKPVLDILDAFIFKYMSDEKVSVEEFEPMLTETIGLLSKLLAEKQKAEIEIKEGRVLSGKNKKIIEDAISQTKDAVVALEKLLELSNSSTTEVEEKVEPATIKEETPEKANGDDKIIKGREPKAAQKSAPIVGKQIIVRALQQIARNSNLALNKLKSNE